MIKALLLDADGVLQYPEPDWLQRFRELGGSDDFLTALSAAEASTLTGQADLADLVEDLIAGRGLSVTFEDVIANWCRIRVDEYMLKLVGRVRATGVVTALATNQQSYRGRYMQREFDYDRLLDRTFYSFEVGLRKPDPAYFDYVLGELGLAADEAVFVDDLAANVQGARRACLKAALFPVTATYGDLRLKLREFGLTGF